MMSKAVLVLDEMPENCRECQFEDQDDFRRKNICNATASDRVISDFEDEIDEDERPDWCPLKELPKYFGMPETSDLDHWAMETGFDQFQILAALAGFDSCLNMIEGTEDKDGST